MPHPTSRWLKLPPHRHCKCQLQWAPVLPSHLSPDDVTCLLIYLSLIWLSHCISFNDYPSAQSWLQPGHICICFTSNFTNVYLVQFGIYYACNSYAALFTLHFLLKRNNPRVLGNRLGNPLFIGVQFPVHRRPHALFCSSLA